MDPKVLVLRKQQKNGVLTNAKREITKAQNLINSDISADIEELELCKKKLEAYRAQLKTFDDEILPQLDEIKMADDAKKSLDFDDILLDFIEKLNIRKKKVEQQPNHVGSNIPLNDVSVSDKFSASVRLPKLQLQQFDGESLNFQQFWDNFENSIHNNSSLSVIDKFTYLRSFLAGDALRLIEGYRLTTANYDAVVSILKERYGDPQVAIFSHFEAMLALPPATHEIGQLRSVYDECEKHIRCLVALGLPEDTFGQVFTPIVLSKLPKFVRMELHRSNGFKKWTLAHLRDLLKEEIHARDMSERTFGSSSKTENNQNLSNSSSHSKFKSPKSSRFQTTTSTLVGSSAESKTSCVYCSGSHYSDQCTKYPDVKSRRATLSNKCLSCLKAGHRIKECRGRRACVYCKRNDHHRSLCQTKFGSKDVAQTENNVSLTVDGPSAKPVVQETTAVSMLSHGQQAILQTAVAQVVGAKTSSARLLLDTGCSRSFMTTHMCQKIGARRVGDEVIAISGFGATVRKSVSYPTFEFDVVLRDGGRKSLTVNAIDCITCPVQKIALDCKKHPFVQNLPLAEPLCAKDEMVQVDVLVGADYYYDFVGHEQVRCSDGLIFLSSSLGYVATGRVEKNKCQATNANAMLLTRSSLLPESNFELERFWRLEDIGIKDPVGLEEDDVALQQFNESIKFNGSRYEVKWPWKNDGSDLADNYALSFGRLKSLLRRLDVNPELKGQYNGIISDQLEKQIIEPAPKETDGDKVYYIPHHCVVTPQKTTTKMRIVYDASSKSSSNVRSLNECVLRGPVLLADLCGLIMRFRLPNIAVISDIEKAFLQVMLQKADRDVTRFLWLRDIKAPLTQDNLVVFRFCRVPFGVNASPFLLAGTIAHHLATIDSPVSKNILDNVYVDNVLGGCATTAELCEYYSEAKNIFKLASMNLREWYSNDSVFMQQLPACDRGNSSVTKVLGIIWDTTADTLSCTVGSTVKSIVSTKRQMLKAVASVYDPCGYFSPITIHGKQLLQEIWKSKYGWDDALPKEILERWKLYQYDLIQLKSCPLVRQYSKSALNEGNRFDLHCFCDASAKAFTAAVYLRVLRPNNTVTTSLVFCKARVSPIKTISIPRLELLAIFVGSRIIDFVEKQLRLPICSRIVWSDSQCALHWVLGKDVSSVFVRNRVRQIRSNPKLKFRYVPTETNPADLSSRGVSFQSLSGNNIWWCGPSWLQTIETEWPPMMQLSDKASSKILSEVTETNSQQLTVTTDTLIDIQRFSSLQKLIRVTAWVLRFVSSLKKVKPSSQILTCHDVAHSLIFWIKVVQRAAFCKLFTSEFSSQPLTKSLQLFFDKDELIRCGGRLQNANASDETKFPILLPKKNYFTRLVIADCHTKIHHGGVKHTLSELRLVYWIIHGRTEVKQCLNNCRVCRRYQGGPFRVPDAAPLPDFRAVQETPFSCVGLDYLGPLLIRIGDQETQKVWICLFTCAVVRAIHLEVVGDLSATEFLLCFRRFMALYGKPRLIVSDNAKQFHLSRKVIDRLWVEITGSDEVQDFATNQGISWKFIVEKAPWMGGFYERLIGLVKNALKKSIHGRKLNLGELQTVIGEIASTLNTRPLVYVEDDVSNNALTPAHFLCQSGPRFPAVTPEVAELCPQPTSETSLILQWKRLQILIDSFWSMWQKDYLLSLREQWLNKRQRGVCDFVPQPGTVVLIKHDLPRSRWKLGVIVHLNWSRDRVCRSARLRLGNGQMINRPIKMLYPLEYSNSSNDNTSKNIVSKSVRPPTRAAAVQAAAKMKIHSSRRNN